MSNETQSFTEKYHLVILIMGIAVLLVGVVNIALNVSFVNRTVATEGTVVWVEFHRPTVGDDYGHYYTKVEFKTSEGQLVSFKQEFSEVHVGDKVKVLYNPSNPSEVRIYRAYHFWGWWSLIAAIGTVVFVVGLSGWLSKLKSQKESRPKAQVD